jgi:hypothetical protein
MEDGEECDSDGDENYDQGDNSSCNHRAYTDKSLKTQNHANGRSSPTFSSNKNPISTQNQSSHSANLKLNGLLFEKVTKSKFIFSLKYWFFRLKYKNVFIYFSNNKLI